MQYIWSVNHCFKENNSVGSWVYFTERSLCLEISIICKRSQVILHEESKIVKLVKTLVLQL